MMNYFLKSQFYLKLKEFRSFLLLTLLVALAIISISVYDKFRYNQSKDLQSILQNIYFQKTLSSISRSLEPRFEKYKYRIKEGENLKVILENLDLGEAEIKKL